VPWDPDEPTVLKERIKALELEIKLGKEPGGLTYKETLELRARCGKAESEAKLLKIENAKLLLERAMQENPFKLHDTVKVKNTPSVGKVNEVINHEEVSVVFGTGACVKIHSDRLELCSPREFDSPVRAPFTMKVGGTNLEVDWDTRKVRVWEEG
jgi:hypothetical protein